MGNAVRRVGQSCGILKKPRPPNRTVLIGNHPPADLDPCVPEKFCGNRVKSSKYTILTFLPKNLFEQFRRIANFYFLCVGIISLIIDSPVSPLTSLLPLCFVIAVTAIKQGYEDWLRHKADNEVNNRPAYVIRNGSRVPVRSMDIRVGDIVQVQANQGIPCDMVLLSSHDPDGECYITTANLDGETNLKTFSSLHDTRSLQAVEALDHLRGTIECEQPITDLYRFKGRMNIHNSEGVTTRSLGPTNVLLRGSRLKNTRHIYGCAIYTGQETKIALNSKYKSSKVSRIEKTMNKFLIVFIVVLVVWAAIMTGLKHWFYADEKNRRLWYTEPERELKVLTVIEEYLSFMVLVNYIIPISLYVTIELQKFFGSMFFAWDLEMYDAQINEPAKANTSDINEELGQVEHLFSDKTGTLTENCMEFRQCAIRGIRYTEVGGHIALQPDIPGAQPSLITTLSPDMEEFFTVLALCHTVRVDRKNEAEYYSKNGFDYEYQASSPDEKAFLEACRRYNVVYHGVRDDKAEVAVEGRMQRYSVLHVLEFDPTRKRMSVIIQDEQGQHTVLCKGAESAILNRVVDVEDVENVEKQVTEYAHHGLRTLVIAHRHLSQDEFLNFDNQLKEAKQSLDDREGKLEVVFDEIEQDLTLLGVTAIEDQLQDGVPEALQAIMEAGIMVWVLTGDKEETAVNISYSAGHFTEAMTELRLTKCRNEEEATQKLIHLDRVLRDAGSSGQKSYALIVDGMSLALVMTHRRQDFLDVCERCMTVLCCRMSPIQKAQVVALVKHSGLDVTTAAIGDGANDVSMIQEAHVGLGLFGKEGRQAARSSDYAFGRFRFVKRALLVHGHLFYSRLAILVLYFFYKNVAFITAQFYFIFYSAFSAQSIYDTFFLTFYNVSCTTLPVLLYGLMEQYISIDVLEAKPHLYRRIRRNAMMNWGQFLKWNIIGLWHSVVSFFGVYACFYTAEPMTLTGKGFGVYEYGAIVFTVVVMVVNIKLMIETFYWNGIMFFGFIFTIVIYFTANLVYSAVIWSAFLTEYSFFWSQMYLMMTPTFYFILALLIVGAILPDIILRVYENVSSNIPRRAAKQKLGDDQLGQGNRVGSVSETVGPSGTRWRGSNQANGFTSAEAGHHRQSNFSHNITAGIVNPAFSESDEHLAGKPVSSNNNNETHKAAFLHKRSQGVVNPAFTGDADDVLSVSSSNPRPEGSSTPALPESRPSSGLREETTANISSTTDDSTLTRVESPTNPNLHTTRSASSVELIPSLSEITPL